MSSRRVLVVHGDPVVRFGICDYLRRQSYVVGQSATSKEARLQFQTFHPNAAIIDSSGHNGCVTELLDWLTARGLSLPIIVVGDHSANIVSASGNYTGELYALPKPLVLPAIERQLTMALEGDRLRRESKARHRKSIRNPEHPFLGTSAAIRKLEQLANRLLTSESPILIQGATGSGKGVLASWIHSNGTRSKEGFHNLNCAGLSQELLESELFGHRRGAFTGAVESKTGLLEVADHGTLFLDEIGDVDLTVQAKLLKVLEEQRFRRLGEVHERMVDIRLISATRWSLEKLIQDGAFREDLYYRINVVGITIPSLCERREDIPVLANHLLQDLCYECGRKPLELESSAIEALRRHPWPGNIRELRNVLERAAQFCDSGSLTANDLQFVSRTSPCASPSLTPENISGLTLRQMESVIIGAVLQEEGGSVERAARRLGIARSSLYNKMKVLAGRPAANA